MLETVFSLTALTFFVIGGAIAYGITASRRGKSDAAIRTLYRIAKRDVRYPHAR